MSKLNNSERSKNVIKNSVVALVGQSIYLIFSFVSRTFFIKLLGSSYLGINGLFTNILSLLSLAELGFGTAMNYNLYSAINNEDIGKIKSLMHYYKKIYICIGLIIIILGGLITPFVPYLISSNVQINANIYIVFFLYVLNTACTYFFSYRTAFISANQLKRIVDFWTIAFNICREILAVLVLYFSNSFYLYLIIQILLNSGLYIFLHYKSTKMYPYLGESDFVQLSKREKSAIFKNVGALMIYKVASVILGSTDNILISVMVDTFSVGLLSNYTLLTNAIKNLLNKVVNGYMASLGIANSHNTDEQKFSLFKILRIVIFWIFGYVSIGILIMINDVITIWVGVEYLLGTEVVIAMSLYFWLEGCGNLTYSFRTTTGLFKESQFTPLLAAILNIIFSVLLGYFWGIFGILIATSITRLLTYFLIDPLILYKKKFKKNPIEYFAYFFLYTGFSLLIVIMSQFIVSRIPGVGIGSLCIKLVTITILINFMYFLFFAPQKEFKELVNKLIFLKKGRGRIK